MDRRRLIRLFAAGLAALVATGPANAQYRLDFNYCDGLQAQYLSALQRAGDTGTSGRQMAQIGQLTQQLAQVQGAARRYGCTGGFLFFTPRAGPQCPAIMAQVNRLNGQLNQLRGDNGFFFFGSSPADEAARLRDELNNNGCAVPSAGGTRTLCVRLCDGYYFPIEYSASSRRFDIDAAACQSMYTQDGQAELFVQPNSGEVADATSLSSDQRYGDQSYAFLYRQSYAPSCAAQLHDGISALASRYFAKFPPPQLVAAAPRTPLPVPQLRRPASDDPETLADAAGHFTIKPVSPAPTVALGDAPSHVRMVGPSYYADLFDLTKVRQKQQPLRPSFSIVTPAEASEGPAAAPPQPN